MIRKASEILDAMLPPEASARASDYRPYAQNCLGALDGAELRAVCLFFQTDVANVTAHAIRYQLDRAEQARRLAQSAARKGAQPCART